MEELGNKALIEKLPKEGVHCYPANPSKITRNRIVSVIVCVIGLFLLCFGLIKVANTDLILKIALCVVGGLSTIISILVFAQSFLIAKFRVAVDYNEKNVVLRYRYSKIAIPFENFDGRDGSPDQAEALIDKNFKKDATFYLVLDDVFEDACYQTSSSDLESVDDFKLAEAYGARNSKDKVKFYYEKDEPEKDTGSTDIDAVIEETKAEQKADAEAEAAQRAVEQAAREAEEAAKAAEEASEEAEDAESEEKSDEE